MDCSTPGLPVHDQLPGFTQTHIHWVNDAILTISSSVVPFSPCLQCFSASGSFHMSEFFTSGGPSIGVSAWTSVLPMNIQDKFLLEWTVCISLQFKGHTRVFFNTTIQKHQFLSTSFLYSPTLTSICDYWKNQSLDYMDLCWQSNVSGL